MEEAGLGCNYTLHGTGLFPSCCNGSSFTTEGMGVTGDYIADLSEDMAAEEKARATYEHLMDLTKDEDVLRVLTFLRERELVHFALFKELYDTYKEKNIK
jgi:spore coat protein JC